MKRLSLGLFVAALVVLTGCSSDAPSTSLDGKLSANSRAAESEVQATATTRRRPRTTTTRRPRPNTTTTRRNRPPTQPTAPTAPTTPTTMSRTGVAGAVTYEKNCAPDRPCSLEGGPAELRLISGRDVIARGNARDSGAFVIEAPPGNYTLEAKPANKRQACDPVDITVPADGYVTVQVTCGAK